jgi:hypothetical protein
MKTTFETGKQYGNDLTLEVISRTEKTAVIKTNFGTQRIKINQRSKCEVIYFKCWLIEATENFDIQVAREISYYNAYCR